MKDFLLDDDNDIQFDANGELVIGESELQEVALILQMNQGDLKSFPMLGANLVQLLKGKEKRHLIEERIRVHLGLDGKDYNAIKKYLQTKPLIK